MKMFFTVVLLALPSVVLAEVDFKKETLPGRWVQQLVPEDLPALELPSYYNKVDVARAQMQAGRYRQALITLAGAKDGDAIEVALVRASSLNAIGRTEKALATLDYEKVKDDPRAKVLRARVLSGIGEE